MKNNCKIKNSCNVFDTYKNYDAYAILIGGPLAPRLKGSIYLTQLNDGVLIQAYITNIPAVSINNVPTEFHALHIHEYGNCTVGDPDNPFLSSGDVWSASNLTKSNYTGELPSILSNNGTAMMSVFTNRFYLIDAIGRSFILHEKPDDLLYQSTNNTSKRLACGTIKLYNPCLK